MNNKLKKNIVRSFIGTFYRKKLRRKNWNLFGSGVGSIFSEADPDPHQNEADPKQCMYVCMSIFIFTIPNFLNIQHSVTPPSFLGRVDILDKHVDFKC